MNEKVYLGIPTHDGRVNQGVVNAIFSAGPGLAKSQIETGSALTTNFNKLYCAALNERKEGITHFCMLHEDVWPKTPLWLTKLVNLMNHKQADMLSAVIRLKDESGLTSTALEIPDASQYNGFRGKKLTLDEIYEKYPATFTDPLILLNTGLMLLDIRKPWADKVWFEFKDSIANDKGFYFPVALSEDYGFSRMWRSHGGSLYATTEIEVTHNGNGKFGNRPTKVLAEA